MEAVWTRFFPGVLELKRLLHSERILGKIHRVISDFSLNLTHIRNFQHRLYDPTLGGGALLDLGLYPITWAFMTLFDDPDNQVNGQKIAPIVHASMILSQGKPEDGWKGPVDESTSITLTFEKLHATAVLTTSLLCHTTYGRSVLIQGDKGDIIIPSSAPRPGSYILQLKGQEPTTVEIPNGGLHWQADACARAIRSDKTGTVECPMEDTLAVMTVMDAVRKQGGLAFPADLEAVRT
ncbi:hypothetical protein FRC03_007291 [Tulasnella sp. 419]|nr:hypothetical protein FRC03_007291 [Tulasnella sp. 419]